MKRVYEEKFLKENAEKKPEDILQGLRKKALATVDHVRVEGRKDSDRLKAAESILGRTDPIKQKHEHGGINGDPIDHKITVEFK